MAPDEKAAYWAKRGYLMIDGYDRQRVLDSIRESRRRYARDTGSQALDEITRTVRKTFTEELGDGPGPVDVLLHVAFSLGPYAIQGLAAEDVLNVIARLADDLTES